MFRLVAIGVVIGAILAPQAAAKAGDVDRSFGTAGTTGLPAGKWSNDAGAIAADARGGLFVAHPTGIDSSRITRVGPTGVIDRRFSFRRRSEIRAMASRGDTVFAAIGDLASGVIELHGFDGRTGRGGVEGLPDDVPIPADANWVSAVSLVVTGRAVYVLGALGRPLMPPNELGTTDPHSDPQSIVVAAFRRSDYTPMKSFGTRGVVELGGPGRVVQPGSAVVATRTGVSFVAVEHDNRDSTQDPMISTLTTLDGRTGRVVQRVGLGALPLDLALAGDGAGGRVLATQEPDTGAVYLRRYGPDGRLDPSYGGRFQLPDGFASANWGFAMVRDGKQMIVSGTAGRPGPEFHGYWARLDRRARATALSITPDLGTGGPLAVLRDGRYAQALSLGESLIDRTPAVRVHRGSS